MAKTIIGRRANTPVSRAPKASTTPTIPAPEPDPTIISLDGVMSYNTCVNTPMAMMNPKATLADLLSWADGQLEQVHTLADSIGGGALQSDEDAKRISTALCHFIKPVCVVLQEAASRAYRAEMRQGRVQQSLEEPARGKRQAAAVPTSS